MADQLDIDPDMVLGKLIRVWIWADQQTYDGNAGSVTSALLDRISSVPGFSKALEKVGWLVKSESGNIFPNFDRHNGKTAKSRALTSIRVKQHRDEKEDKRCNADSVTPSSLSLPLELFSSLIKKERSDEFRKCWDEWIKYRFKRGKPITSEMAPKQLAKMEKWGEERAISAINHTIAMGWIGLREPDERDRLDREMEVPQI